MENGWQGGAARHHIHRAERGEINFSNVHFQDLPLRTI